MDGVGVLRRLFTQRPCDDPVPRPTDIQKPGVPESAPPPTRVVSRGGRDSLEVVGESHYQDALWRIAGGRTTERIRKEAQAVLKAESTNPYDPNAIAVWIRGDLVGYLSREDAAAYRPGLLAIEARHGGLIELACVVVGGGIRADGPGFLGVWLFHDPADFGIEAVVPPLGSDLRTTMRTGATEAWRTDEEDDSYDLSWLERLPSNPINAIGCLRQLLQHDPDPLDRHFMFSELEERLYRSREVFASALAEYDDVCAQHDSEMDIIRASLMSKFGRIPLLETYRQMAIRQQKAKNWPEALRWAERGLTLYGKNAARPEAVEDLQKRVAAYTAKLSARRPNPERG